MLPKHTDPWPGCPVWMMRQPRFKCLPGLVAIATVSLVLTFATTYKYKVFFRVLAAPYQGLGDVEQVMASRRSHLKQICARDKIEPEHFTAKSVYMVHKHDFSICRVAKVGSTFWVRFLYQMVHTSPIQSPFGAKGSSAYAYSPRLRMKAHELAAFRSTKIRVLFAREPFSRLFSAYMDKLFDPNFVYWKIWGIPAVSKFRPGVEVKGRQCGSDTSFPEFVSLATSHLYHNDNHVMPVSSLCSPCQNNFTVIGKMKTFQRDAAYVASLLGMAEREIRFDEMVKDVAADALTASVSSLREAHRKLLLQCVSLESLVQRIWRINQIRGFISWRQRLRLTEAQKKNISSQELKAMLMEARASSSNATELKMQKKQAFAEALSQLSPQGFEDIQRVYGDDFKLFNYSRDLPHDLAMRFPKDSSALDYTKDWNLAGL